LTRKLCLGKVSRAAHPPTIEIPTGDNLALEAEKIDVIILIILI
jgi:hypothetical protein